MKYFWALLLCIVGFVHAEPFQNEPCCDNWYADTHRSLFNINAAISKGEYHIFDSFIWDYATSENYKLSVKSEALSFRLVKDKDSYQFSITEPISAVVASLGVLVSYRYWGFTVLYATMLLFNPSVELFPFPQYVPLSLSLGYHFDYFWFCKHPALFFEPHVDLNAEIKFLRLSASLGYLVSDVYDLKQGFRFHVGLGVFGF